MTDLQKQFEATGYASWINSELYPDGQIYTKEYTQWLEKQLEAKKQANQEIIAAIALQVEAGDPDWKDAPEWAEWRIFDDKRNIAYSQGFPSDNTQMQVPKNFGTTQIVERRPQ